MALTGLHTTDYETTLKNFIPRSHRPRWECLQRLISTIKITIKRYTEVYTPTLEHGSECIDK